MGAITIAYGMTETSPVSFQSSVEDSIDRRVTTIGRVTSRSTSNAFQPSKYCEPSVSVKISEQHFRQTIVYVIDPAAQTELSKVLQQCGFQVVDDNSTNRPDIEITGEALSEFGMSKGNLQSCKARVEVKMRDRKSGEILAEDAQTSVAVDVAEHIAAKTALQNAADALAERLLPKLGN